MINSKGRLFYMVSASALIAVGAWAIETRRVNFRDELLLQCNTDLKNARSLAHESHRYALQLEGRLNQCLKELPPEKVNWNALREICPKMFGE